jgi:hypothetical protein
MKSTRRDEERAKKDLKNAHARRKRSIKRMVHKAHEIGRMYNFKVYVVIQTERGDVTIYNNAADRKWPPTNSQLVSIPSLLLPGRSSLSSVRRDRHGFSPRLNDWGRRITG